MNNVLKPGSAFDPLCIYPDEISKIRLFKPRPKFGGALLISKMLKTTQKMPLLRCKDIISGFNKKFHPKSPRQNGGKSFC